MSVDDRLREAFSTSDDPSWRPDRATALRAVKARRRREVAVRRGGAAAVGLAAAAVLVAALAPAPGEPGPTRDLGPTVTPTDEASSVERLAGVWRTDMISAQDVRDALETSGDAHHASRLLSRIPTPFRLVWTVDGTLAQMRVAGRDEQFVIDDEVIAVGQDELVLTARYDVGESVHEIVTDGSQLRLDFVSTTEASTGGLPGEVWQRVLYDAFDFTRRR